MGDGKEKPEKTDVHDELYSDFSPPSFALFSLFDTVPIIQDL